MPTLRDVLQAILGRRLANPGREFFNAAVESGSWTPTIEGQTTAGAGTYSAQDGYYLRFGQVIAARWRVNWSAHTGTGSAILAGLPFAASAVTGASTDYWTGATYSGNGFLGAIALVRPGLMSAFIYDNANPRVVAAVTTTGDFLGSVIYWTD